MSEFIKCVGLDEAGPCGYELYRRLTRAREDLKHLQRQTQEHRRVGCRRATVRVLARQLAQLKLIDHLNHEAGKTVCRQPVVHRRRQQLGSVSVNREEAAHL